MKRVLVTVLLVFNLTALTAQEWKNDLDDALREAVATNKKVLLFFTVPDACDLCVALEQRVLRSAVFVDYADKNYILTRLEFRNSPGYTLSPEAKAKNLLIVEKYNKDGFFPLVVLLNKQEKVLGKIGVYNYETPMQYLQLLQSIENN